MFDRLLGCSLRGGMNRREFLGLASLTGISSLGGCVGPGWEETSTASSSVREGQTIGLETVVEGFTQPMEVEFVPGQDARIVADKPGTAAGCKRDTYRSRDSRCVQVESAGGCYRRRLPYHAERHRTDQRPRRHKTRRRRAPVTPASTGRTERLLTGATSMDGTESWRPAPDLGAFRSGLRINDRRH